MALLSRKIDGSTLVEVLIAMVIVMIAFGLSLMIYINVLNSNNNQQRLNAHLLMNDIALETKSENSYLDTEYELETIKIVKTLLPYGKNDKLQLMLLEAFTKKGRKIGERQELVIVE